MFHTDRAKDDVDSRLRDISQDRARIVKAKRDFMEVFPSPRDIYDANNYIDKGIVELYCVLLDSAWPILRMFGCEITRFSREPGESSIDVFTRVHTAVIDRLDRRLAILDERASSTRAEWYSFRNGDDAHNRSLGAYIEGKERAADRAADREATLEAARIQADAIADGLHSLGLAVGDGLDSIAETNRYANQLNERSAIEKFFGMAP